MRKRPLESRSDLAERQSHSSRSEETPHCLTCRNPGQQLRVQAGGLHVTDAQRLLVQQDSDTAPALGGPEVQQQASDGRRERLEQEDDLDEGDSFFDDPLPKPQKTYGW